MPVSVRSCPRPPLLDREHRGADRHARAMERHRADILVEIERLESSQDDLLDKLAAGH